MRVLLDECLPRGLKTHLSGHEVWTVPEMGWAGMKDAELLRLAAAEFDALITIDRGLPPLAQRSSMPLTIVLLSAQSNRLADLQPLTPEVRSRLATAPPGELIHVPADV